MLLRDLLQRWNGRTDQENDRQPGQDDGDRQPTDRPRHEWRSGVLGAPLLANHAPFSTQKVKAFTSCEVFSALITPSTTMRQPMLLLFPWATMFPMTAAEVVVKFNVQGKCAPSTRRGSASTSK